MDNVYDGTLFGHRQNNLQAVYPSLMMHYILIK